MSEKLIGSCIFGQSGGPTAVINASAYGVIKTALEAGEITRVYGASYGIKGVLADRLYVMDEEDPEELRLLPEHSVLRTGFLPLQDGRSRSG